MIALRPADLTADRHLIIDFLRKNLTSLSNEARFDWLYRRNPAGQARAWLAWEDREPTLVGLAAAFPREFCVNGATLSCWCSGTSASVRDTAHWDRL